MEFSQSPYLSPKFLQFKIFEGLTNSNHSREQIKKEEKENYRVYFIDICVKSALQLKLVEVRWVAYVLSCMSPVGEM